MSTLVNHEPYGPYLGQVDRWPSEKEGEAISVHEMNPAHAINAYRKLCDWAVEAGHGVSVKRTPLAMALLQRAVGEPVLYADDVPDTPASGVLDLESAYDILATIDDYQINSSLHPIARARMLLGQLAGYGVEVKDA